MEAKELCEWAEKMVSAVQLQRGLPGSCVQFRYREREEGALWFYCPQHLELGEFRDSLSLLAEVLEAEGHLTGV